MITKLLIKNFALIEVAKLEFGENLNIISGETGSGKSMILSALDILLGARWTPKMFFNPNEKSILEAHFFFTEANNGISKIFSENDLDFESETIIRRETTPSGRNRIFINDTPTSIQVLKNITNTFFNIHSQHQNVYLTNKQNQLLLIDGYIKENIDPNFYSLKDTYKKQYESWKEIKEELATLEEKKQDILSEKDYRDFQLEELEKLNLDTLVEEELKETIDLIENQEKISTTLSEIKTTIDNSENPASVLEQWIFSLTDIENSNSNFKDWKKRIESSVIDLKDLFYEIQSFEMDNSSLNQNIDELHSRLYNLETLKIKHQVNTVEELKNKCQTLSNQSSEIVHLENKILKLKQEINDTEKILLKKAQDLHNKREQAIKPLTESVHNHLKELSMPNAQIFFQLNKNEILSKSGYTDIEFLFAANKGFEAQKIQQTASGGEFARLSLVLQYILNTKQLNNTIVLDEIDTGVSGEVAHKMGKMMEQMASKSQVICISHLAQVVSKGKTHFKVQKKDNEEKSFVRVNKLNEEERIKEIATLLSGENILESSINTAKSLLSQKN